MGLCLFVCGVLWFVIMFLTGQLNFQWKYDKLNNNCGDLCRGK
jgi:hypothetical protein